MPVNEKARKGVRMLARVTGPDEHKERGFYSTGRGRKEYIWNSGDALGCLSGLPAPSGCKRAICTTITWKGSELLEKFGN